MQGGVIFQIMLFIGLVLSGLSDLFECIIFNIIYIKTGIAGT